MKQRGRRGKEHRNRSISLPLHLAELACWRQLVYRLLSSTLLYPDTERVKAITVAAAELGKQSHLMGRFIFFPQWQQLLSYLADLQSYQALEEEYIRVFMHGRGKAPCLPYESAYIDPEGRAAGWLIALLEREYASAGLALSPSLKDLPDHIAVELEFMSFLCSQEADAWNRKAAREGMQTLEQQATFLNRHLARWFPQWAQQVINADSESVYSVVAETARAFISHDQDLISLLLHRFQGMPEMAQAEAAVRKQHCGSYCRVS